MLDQVQVHKRSDENYVLACRVFTETCRADGMRPPVYQEATDGEVSHIDCRPGRAVIVVCTDWNRVAWRRTLASMIHMTASATGVDKHRLWRVAESAHLVEVRSAV